MRTPFAIAITCAILGGCAIIVAPGGDAAYSIEGNGVPARDERMIATVPALEVNGTITVDVRVGPATMLVVEADSNLLPFIRTELRGDRLVIEKERSFRTNHPVRVTYTVPRLTNVRHDGSGYLSVQDLNGGPLVVEGRGSGAVLLTGRVSSLDVMQDGSGSIDATTLQSGGGNLTLNGSGRVVAGRMQGERLTASLNGSGQLRATGAVRHLAARSNGSGHLDLADLVSEQADLSSTGSGGMTANVQQSLVAQNGGSGGIRVYGNPAQRTVSGKLVQVVN
ncbi:MAG: head GIN domain-containing protein [Massilia sp.]